MKNYENFEEKMARYHVMIWNATEPDIMQVLATASFNSERLEAMKLLYNNTQAASDSQKNEYKEKNQAYDVYSDKKAECEASFKTDRRWFRQALHKHINEATIIGLYLALDVKTFPRLQQIIKIYENMLASELAMGLIAKYAITPEKINAAIDKLKNILFLYDKVILEKGEAQLSTQQRNEVIEQLDEDCTELKVVASLLFVDSPQILNKLGIKPK